ncbi:hypothetical protein JX265_002695 [Neoarthrinium moseri]|uniref:RING-type domain-containing protein n=1 Tax=Neoarthrinium moseri TaxID=1658444 RepID=A0A9P9WVI3_9PEZI|nr:hypothetical protein JX265_002695 [Neoarthrinium moseri]
MSVIHHRERRPWTDFVDRTLQRIKKHIKPSLCSASSSKKRKATNPEDEPPSYELTRMIDGYKGSIHPRVRSLMLMEATSRSEERFTCTPGRQAYCGSEPADIPHVTLPCGHKFHMQCISDWSLTSWYSRCPTCQQTLHYRRCGHHVYFPYLHPNTVMDPDEFDGACAPCAPTPKYQGLVEDPPRPYQMNRHDSQWAWWLLNVFEGGDDRFHDEKRALRARTLIVCPENGQNERKHLLLLFDELYKLHTALKTSDGLNWVDALSLCLDLATGYYFDNKEHLARMSNRRRGLNVWRVLLHTLVMELRRFEKYSEKAGYMRFMVPFAPYFRMVTHSC